MPTNFPTQQQFNAFIHAVHSFVLSLPKVGLLVLLVIVCLYALKGLAVVALRLLDIRRLLGKDMVFLELTPLAFSDKFPQANEQFFSDLHGYETTLAITDRMLARKFVFTVEMVGGRISGIRYIFCVPRQEKESFERAIASYGTEIRVQEVEDYLTRAQRLRARLLEFKLKEQYYPLAAHDRYEQGDPVAYLLGAMAHLKADELMVVQLVLSPTSPRQAQRIHNRMLRNQEHMDTLGRRRQGSSFGGALVHGIRSSLFAAADMVGETYHGPSAHGQRPRSSTAEHYRQAAMGIKPHRSMGQLEETLAQKVGDKFDQQKFRANIRALIVADNPQSELSKVTSIRKSFNVYRTSRQAIKGRSDFPYRVRGVYRRFMFTRRLPSVLNRTSCLLSVSEVASIYHFPNSESIRNGDVTMALSRTLSAPIAVRNSADSKGFDVMLGRNHHLGARTDIGLLAAERERHVFIVGATGSGKTTLIKYAAVQDLRSGKGLAMIDPHGDIAQELLTYIPEERVGDVVYFNPDDLAYPVGLNVLELTPGLEGDDLVREKDLVTESVVSMFRKIFSKDDSGGHRIEYVLRNAIQTALTVPDATLFTVYNLLNDPDYCIQVIKKLDNDDLQNFWKNELGKAGEFQQVKMVAGITAKIGRFLFSAAAKRVLEQPKSTIDFDEILDGKILICNFSKGLLGEDTSELFGIAVLAKIQMAALRRARVRQSERKPFYLYVDEFQNFATQSFVQMLSESRKYKLFLTMAEQSTSQQDDQKMVNIILANVGTVVCFRTGNPADEKLLLPLFSPYIEEGGIANLPPYNFYIRMSAVRSQEPLSGETVRLDDMGSEEMAALVIQSSRERYATRYVPPEPKPKAVKKATKTAVVDVVQNTVKIPPKKKRLRSSRKLTIYQQAAQWMMDEIEREGSLKQEVATVYLDNEFGKRCVGTTEAGNLSIKEKVRSEFREMHRGTVGWDTARQAWFRRAK